jgi:ribosomal protein S18 acetylase RimI-like enzyme
MIGSDLNPIIRKARPGDAEALATVFADSWRQAYGGIIPHMHLENIIRRRGVAWWKDAVRHEGHLIVCEANGSIAGYATCGAARSRGRYQGEIYELYLHPLYQGLGLGEYLFEACRSTLDIRGLNGVIVWALSDNAIAADFYWRRGGRPVSARAERFGNARLGKVAFGFA